MGRRVVVLVAGLAAASGFVAGAIAMLELLDRLLGGNGVDVELRPEHRELLDRHPGGVW